MLGLNNNDRLDGGVGNDFLDGGLGSDRMVGGVGNDIFIVGALGDVIDELAGEGSDQVWASASYVLTADAHVEVLATTANAKETANISLTKQFAGAGDRGQQRQQHSCWQGRARRPGRPRQQRHLHRRRRRHGDRAGAGGDRIQVNLAEYVLPAGLSIELLSTTVNGGTGNLNLTGNELGQAIIGNFGNNILTGGGGLGALVGLGNNGIVIGNVDDTVIEDAGAGNDPGAGQCGELRACRRHGMSCCRRRRTAPARGQSNLTGNELGGAIVGNNGSNNLVSGGVML